MRESISKVLLKVGYLCNNNCVFCHSAPHRGLDLNLEQVAERVALAKSAGANMLVLSGGEPTIHKDLLAIAERVRGASLALGLVTNARMLAYGDLLDRLLDLGLAYAYVSICGPDAQLHDEHTRAPGSFDQAIRALERLSRMSLDLTLNAVITSLNMDRLSGFPLVARELGICKLKFSFIEPEGNAARDFDRLVPGIGNAAKAALSTIQLEESVDSGLELLLDGFPLCLMGAMLDRDCGLRNDGFFGMIEAFEGQIHPIDDDNRAFGRACSDCSLRRRCRGVFSEYLRRRGELELVPRIEPVSNSFNLLPAAAEEAIGLKDCPIRAGTRAPPDPIRGLLVQTKPGRALRHRVDTRDFSDASLRAAIREREQIYLDQSERFDLTDFSRQLAPLSPALTCRRCSVRPRCGAVWKPARAKAFSRTAAQIERALSGLRGSVLDVGCGSAPYSNALSSAIQAGQLEYLGIDPDPDRLVARTQGRIVKSSLEDFEWQGPLFDGIISLRSLNHLHSARAGLERMCSLLHFGGKLILAEDVVFGTVRPAQKLELIERARDLTYDHLHNQDLDDILVLAAELGLTVLDAKTPEQTGCTLWTLILEKRI